MPSWKESTRRALVGDKVQLKTVPELYVSPRKLSTEVADQVNELLRASLVDGENRQKSKELRELEARLTAEGKTLKDADPLEFYAAQPAVDPKVRVAMYRLALADGIGEHNFIDDAGNLIGGGKTFDEATIAEILAWDDLATEIFNVIREWSRPLAQRSGESSSS